MCEHTLFAKDVQIEIKRRQVKNSRQACAVNDGGEWIPPVIDVCRPDAVRILDFYHAAEHLAESARETFGDGSPEFHTWFDTVRHGPAAGHFQLRYGTPESGPLRPCGPFEGLGHDALTTLAELGQAHLDHIETINKTQAYFTKRMDMIDYVQFKNQHWPIGSGSGEAAHKVVIQARMKGVGMRWNPDNINSMAALRNLICKSGRSRGHDRWAADWPLIVAAQMHTVPTPAPSTPVSRLPPGFQLRPATSWRDQPIGAARDTQPMAPRTGHLPLNHPSMAPQRAT